jgi:hypothetical protein
MTDYRDVHSQINTITQKLISIGLSVKQKFPSCTSIGRNSYEIAYPGMQELSIVLRNNELSFASNLFDETITINEKKILHIAIY